MRAGSILGGTMGRKRALALLLSLGLIAAACSRSDSDGGSAEGSTTTTAPTQAASADFGTLKDVCGPGEGGGAGGSGGGSQGVTADSIQVGTFADPGFSGRPGLNQELFDSAEVFTKWCNDLGGINGRQIVLNLRDTALTNVQSQTVEACAQDFFVVGGGAVFDNIGIEDRLECMLPMIPGFMVTPEARDSDLFVHPQPSPPGAIQIGDYRWLGEKYPQATKKVGILTGDIQTTVKVAEDDRTFVEDELGWDIVYSDRYPAAGQVSWSPYVEAMKDRGVEALIWVGEPENFAKLQLAMADAGFTPKFIRAAPNQADTRLVEIAGSALKGNTYMYAGQAPFEEAEDHPALAKYLELFERYKPDAKTEAFLGVNAFTAWLLFAQAAKECGADLTRRCVYDNARKIHRWTGGGLHAPTDPGNNRTSGCYLLLKATPEGFERVEIDTNEGIFNCDPEQNGYVIEKGSDVGVSLSDVNKSLADL